MMEKGESATKRDKEGRDGQLFWKARDRTGRKSHQFHVYMRAFIHFDWINGRMEGERYYNNIYYIFKLYIAITRKRERDKKTGRRYYLFYGEKYVLYGRAKRERNTRGQRERSVRTSENGRDGRSLDFKNRGYSEGNDSRLNGREKEREGGVGCRVVARTRNVTPNSNGACVGRELERGMIRKTDQVSTFFRIVFYDLGRML